MSNAKNDTPDKALVEALEPFKQALADCEGAPDDMAIGDASYSTVLVGDIKRLLSALSQPQHGGLVEACWIIRREEIESEDSSHIPAWASHIAIGGYREQGWAAWDQRTKPVRRMGGGNWGDALLLMRDGSIVSSAALASNSPVVGKMSDAEKADALWGANDMKLHGGRPASECPPGTNTLRRATPTDTADRREAVARIIALHGLGTTDGSDRLAAPNDNWEGCEDEWAARILECVPSRVEQRCYALADAIASLIAVPDGMLEARDAWSKILDGMKRFGMESEAIDTVEDYFASMTARDRWQHVAYFDEGEFHWMSGIAPRDCELYAMIAAATGEAS